METSSEKKNLTFGMLARVIKLSKLQVKAVFSLIGKFPPLDDAELTHQELRYLFAADLLENIKFLRSEQRMAILTGLWYTEFTPTDLIGEQIVFADSQYCTWTGNFGWLNLNTGDTEKQLPCPALETIAYNLQELERQARNAIDNRSGENAKRNAGSVEEQGYVRVSPTDAVYGQVRDGGSDVGPDDYYFRDRGRV
jgi:hypothetical protein